MRSDSLKFDSWPKSRASSSVEPTPDLELALSAARHRNIQIAHELLEGAEITSPHLQELDAEANLILARFSVARLKQSS